MLFKTQFFLSFCLIFLFLNVSGQESYQKSYGGPGDDVGRAVVKTRDSNFLLAGYTDNYGNGGDDVFLMKFDKAGDTLWTKTYGTSGDDQGRNIIRARDGGYCILGETKSASGNQDIYVLKIDSVGNLEWARIIGDQNERDLAFSLVQSPMADSGYVIAGLSRGYVAPGNSSGLWDYFVFKLSQDGQNIIWHQSWGGNLNDHPGGIIVDSPHYVLTGTGDFQGDNTVYVNKLNNSGNLLYDTIFISNNATSNYSDRLFGITQNHNGNYALTGETKGPSNGADYDLSLLTVQNNGGLGSVDSTFGGNSDENGGTILQTKDTGYLILGGTSSFGNGADDIFLVKTDSSGKHLWSRTYGGTNSEGVDPFNNNVALQTDDGDIIVVGETESFGAGQKDIFLLRLDSNGQIGCNQNSPNPTINSGNFVADASNPNIDSFSSINNSTNGGGSNASLTQTLLCPVIADFSYSDTCFGAITQFQDSTFHDSLSSYSWEWSFNDPALGNDFNDWQNPDFSFSETGTYNVELIASTSSDSDTATKQVTIIQNSSATVSITNNNPTICPCESYQVQTNSSNVDSFAWEPSQYFNDPTVSNPTVNPFPEDTFTVKAYDTGGCMVIDTLTIHQGSNCVSSGNYCTFQQTFGGNSDDLAKAVIQSNSGDYVLTGWTESFGNGGRDVYVVKFDQNGDTLWTQAYGGPNEDEGFNLIQTNDENLVVVGHTTSFGAGQEDVYILKIDDSDGSLIWSKVVGGSGREFGGGFDIKESQKDSGLIVHATTRTGSFINSNNSSNHGDHLIFKIDQTGSNVVWSNTIGAQYNDGKSGMAIGNDGNYYFTGKVGVGSGNQVSFRSLDENGFNRFKHVYDSSGAEIFSYGITNAFHDSDFVITGFTGDKFAPPSPNNIFLLKVNDNNGNIETINNEYGGSQNDRAGGVIQTNDSNYLTAGWTESFGNGGRDIYLINVDTNGNENWSRAFGGSSKDQIHYRDHGALIQTHDNGFLVVGETKSFGAGGSDAYIVKTDNVGNSECNQTNPSTNSYASGISNTNTTLDTLIPTPSESTGGNGLFTNSLNGSLCPIQADFSYKDTCFGTYTKFFDSTFSDSLSGYSWSWNFDDPASGEDSTSDWQNPTHQFSDTGTYNVQLTAMSNGDTSTVSKNVTIIGPSLTVSYDSSGTLCYGGNVQLNATSSADSFNWSPGHAVSDSTIANPIATPFPQTTFTVTVTDSNGCQNTDSVAVTTQPDTNQTSNFSRLYGETDNERLWEMKHLCGGGIIGAGMTQSFSGGFSPDEDGLMVRTDQEGEIIWSLRLGGGDQDRFVSVEETFNEGFIGVGWSRSYNAGSGSSAEDMYIVKTDNNGNVDWSRTYGGNDRDRAWSVTQAENGDFMVAGWSQSGNFGLGSGNFGILVLRLDRETGNVVWANVYDDSDNDVAMTILEKDDGNFYVTGSTRSFNGSGCSTGPNQGNPKDIFVMEIDGNGNINWFNVYQGTCENWSRSSRLANNGNGLILSAGTYNYGAGGSDAMLLRLDGNGNVNFARTFGGNQDDVVTGADQLPNGDYVLGGNTNSFSSSQDPYLILTDSNGSLKWSRRYGGTNADNIKRVDAGVNNEIFANGWLNGVGVGQEDAMLMMISDHGDASCFNNPNTQIDTPGITADTTYTLTITGQTIAVQDSIQASFENLKTFLNCPIQADFSYEDTCYGGVTKFYDSTFADSFANYSWTWNFGDTASSSNSSNLQNTTHQFSSSDTFNVELIASNGTDSDTVTKKLVVTQPPFQVSTNDTTICASDSIKLKVSNSSYDSFNWSPGHLVSDSTIAEPYAYPSNDSLSVVIKDSLGCQNSDTIAVKSIDTLQAPHLTKLKYESENVLSLKWDTAGNGNYFKHYEAFRKKEGNAAFKVVDSLSAFDSTKWVDSNAMNADSISYNYFIRAKNVCNALGESSNQLQSVVLSEKVFSDKKAEFFWNDAINDSIYTYDFYYDDGSGASLIQSGFDTLYSLESCDLSGSYWVEGVNASNDTIFSNTLQLDLKDTTAPETSMASASHFGLGNENQYRLAFERSDSADTESYELFSSVNGSPYTSLDTLSHDNTKNNKLKEFYSSPSYPDSNEVCYKVVAKDTCGNYGDTSASHCPANIQGKAGNLENELYWDPYKGFAADSVEVQRYQGAGWQSIAFLPGSDTAYKDPGLACNTSYYYRVIYHQAGGFYEESTSDSVLLRPFDTTAPPTPAMKNATVQSANSLEVNFDTVSEQDVNRYRVYYKANGGAFQPFDTVYNPSTETVNVTHAGIDPTSNQYCYYVEAVDSCSGVASVPSDTHCVMQLSGTGGNLAVDLNWSAYEGYDLSDQVIERKGPAGSWQAIDTIAGGLKSYIDSTNLCCNRSYDYRLEGLEQGGPEVTYSNDITATPFDTVAPPKVNIRNATVQNSDSIQLIFDTVNDVDVDHYEVHAKAGGGSFSQIAMVSDSNASPLTYIHTGIDPQNQQYCYQVFAVDSCSGQVSDSTEVHCPAALSGDSLNKANGLSWSGYKGYDVDRYVIQRYNAGLWNNYDTVSGTDSSYVDTPLSCYKAYHYRIKAEEQGGANSVSYSDSQTLIPYDTIDPEVPEIYAAGVEGDSTTELSWQPSSKDVNRYVVYRNDSGGAFQAIDTLYSRIDTTYIDSLNNGIGRSYCYKVRAIDSCANNISKFSDPHCTIFLTSDTSNCVQEIDLSWNAYQGWDTVDQYEIYRSKDGGGMSLLTTVDSTTTSYTDGAVDFHHSYCYQVKAYEANDTNVSNSNDTCNQPFMPNKPLVEAVSKTVTDSVSGIVKVRWKNQQSEPHLTHQKLYYKGPDSSDFKLLSDSIPLSKDSFVHNGLNTETANHQYFLTTIDSCGNESDSAAIHESIDLEFSVGQLLHELSWTPYKGWPVARYEVQRYQGGRFQTIDTLPGSDTSQNRYPQPCNFPISYRIKAVDSQGHYAYSDTGEKEAIDTVSPDHATQRNVTIIEDSVVKVRFTGADSLDIFSYDVMRKRGNGNFQLAERVIFDSSGGDFTIYDTTNALSDRLCYTVLTQDSCLNTVSSDTFCATNLQGVAKNLGNDLSWDRFEGYPLDSQYLLTYNGAGYDTLARLSGADSSYTHGPLPCNVPVTYRILSYESGGSRETWSSHLTLTPFDTLKPSTPNLTQATVQNSDSIRITWDTSGDIDVNRYEVFYAERGTSFQSASIISQQSQQPNVFTHDTGAIDPLNKSYCYYVEAIDSCSDVHSLPSDTHCVIELNGTAGNLRSELNWTAYSGSKPVDSYHIERSKSGSWQEIAVVGGSDTSYTDDQNLKCNRPYSYRILAEWKDDSTLYSLSDTNWVTPFDTLKPASPDLIQATVQNSDSITIKWDTSADNDVDRYEIFYAKRGDSFESAGIVTEQNQQLNSFTYDTSAIAPLSESYCYYVEAIDSCSDVHSMPSDTHCVIELEAKDGLRQSHLSWTPYEGANVDSVTIGRNRGAGWQTIDTLAPADSQYIDKGANDCNVAFDYRITAYWYSDSVVTSLSDTSRAIPFDTVNPKAPYIESFSVKGPDSAEVTWQLSDPDVKQYELWLKTKNGTWQNMDTVGVQTSHTFGNINTLDSQYCTSIVAVDSCAANRSNYSTSNCAIQLTGKPGQKENLLNWTSYEGWDSTEAYYIYNQNLKNPGWKIVDTVKGNDTSYTHAGITCKRPQHYKIEGKNDSGFTAFSDSITLTPFDTVSPDAPAISYVSVKHPDTIEGVFDTASALDLGEYVIYAKAGNHPYQAIDTIADTGQAKNQFTHSGIRPDTGQYCYRVRTIDSCAGNVSEFGDRGCPVELQGTPGNLETILNWEGFKGFFKPTYHIQRKTTNTSWQTLGSKTDTNFNDTQSLACNVTYTYRIRTLSPSGSDTSYSDTLNLQPFDTTAPPVPQLRFASTNLQGEVELEWAWDTKSDQKYFEVWRDQGNGNYTIRNTITYDSTFLDASATPGKTPHNYFVRAIDSCAADGTLGAPGNRSIPSDTDRVMVPEMETGACQPEARLSWTPYEELPQGIDFYRIHRRDSNSSNFQQVARVVDTAYTDTNILDHTLYCYRMEAVDTQSGYTAFSDSVCMQPFVYPDPQPAEMSRATVSQTGKSNGSIELEWNRSPINDTFARGYRLYHRTSNSQYIQIADIADLTDTTYSHTGINTTDSLHHYFVSIYNLCDVEGMPSDTHRAIRLTLTNQNLSTGLNWTHYEGFDVNSYEIHRSLNNGPQSVIEVLNDNDTAYIDSNIRCGQTYSYEVKAYDQSGNVVVWSDSQSVTGYDTIPPTGTNPHSASVIQTGANNGTVELTFSGADQANRKGYYLYKAFGSGLFVPYDTIETSQVNDITYTDDDLNTAKKTHRYFLRAFDSCGNLASPTDTHSTIHLEATPRSHYNNIDWSSYEGWSNYEYEVQRRQGNNNWQTIVTLNGGTTQYDDSNVTCHEVYDYRVLGIEAGTIYEAYSNTDTARAFENESPEPPEITRASVKSTGITNGQVELTWYPSGSEDAAHYIVERRAEIGDWKTLDTTSARVYEDSLLNTAEKSHSYRLKAIDSCGNVSESYSSPHNTIHLTAEPGNEQIDLNWTAYVGRKVDTYQISKNGSLVATVSGDLTSFTDPEVVCDSNYEYEVAALMGDTSVIVAHSNKDEATPFDTRSPEGIYLQSVTVTAFNNGVEVNWEASSAYDAAGYVVYRSRSNETGMQRIGVVEGKTNTQFNDTVAEDAGGYCYRVRVQDHCGNKSELSNRGCVIEPTVEDIEDAFSNNINWAPYQNWRSEGQAYTIYKEVDSGVYEAIGTTDGAASTYVDDALSDTVVEFCYYLVAKGASPDEKSKSVKRCTYQEPVVHIPNSFSPNITEGVNDKFGPKGVFINNYTMKIFNRWGEKIYETTEGKGWNGQYEGKYVPQGVYTYTLRVEGYEGEAQTFQGTVIVVR